MHAYFKEGDAKSPLLHKAFPKPAASSLFNPFSEHCESLFSRPNQSRASRSSCTLAQISRVQKILSPILYPPEDPGFGPLPSK